MRRFLLLLAALLSIRHASAGEKVVVGSKSFTEGYLLGEILAQTIESSAGVPVERRLNLGGTKFAFDALVRGDIDVYAEYTGTILAAILKKPAGLGGSFVTARDLLAPDGLALLRPLGFSNSYALAVRRSDARLKNVDVISQLRDLAPSLRFGSDPETMDRPDGLPKLAHAYGLAVNPGAILTLDSGLMYAAARDKQVDVIEAFATDGRIRAFDLRVLSDDKGFFPPYEAAPLVRAESLARFPGLGPALARLASVISNDEMTGMNYEVDGLGRPPASVARRFLASKGILPREASEPVAAGRGISFPAYLWESRDYVLRLLWQHLALTLAALVAAAFVAVPAGVAITRAKRAAGPVFGAINTLQTIPSLALLGFLIPVLGIGARPAILALFLYALLPLVRNTYTGIREVDADAKEASRAMGLTGWQILSWVELPLALPMIMAGVRTATVILVGTATLASLVGAGGLGEPIFRGISSVQNNMILLGAVPAAVLALALDRALHVLEGAMTSPGLRLGK